MGWHPICKSKSNWQIHAKRSLFSNGQKVEAALTPRPRQRPNCRWVAESPPVETKGRQLKPRPPLRPTGHFAEKKKHLYTRIFFNSSLAPPSPTFPSSELTSLIFLFSVCPPDSFRLFEWKFLMQMCPATHFPVLCFVKYLNWPVVWVYNVYCVQTFHPISPC